MASFDRGWECHTGSGDARAGNPRFAVAFDGGLDCGRASQAQARHGVILSHAQLQTRSVAGLIRIELRQDHAIIAAN
eukprot:4283387-Pleurochrysis_carterae.AAC.1